MAERFANGVSTRKVERMAKAHGHREDELKPGLAHLRVARRGGARHVGAVEGAKVNAPAPAYDGIAAEHAAMTMALVMADNPVPGRKAA